MTKLERHNTIRFALQILKKYADREIESIFKDIERVRESDYSTPTKDDEIGRLLQDTHDCRTRRQHAEELQENEFVILRKNSKKLKSLEQINN